VGRNTRLRSTGSQYSSLTCQDFSHFFSYYDVLTATWYETHPGGDVAGGRVAASSGHEGVPALVQRTTARTPSPQAVAARRHGKRASRHGDHAPPRHCSGHAATVRKNFLPRHQKRAIGFMPGFASLTPTYTGCFCT
jgi:hypothetical protein